MSEPSPGLFWKCPNCDFADLPGEEADASEKQQRAWRTAASPTPTLEQYKKVRLLYIWVSFDSLEVFKNVSRSFSLNGFNFVSS